MGKCRSLVKAGSRGGGNTRRKKGDNRGGTIRERRNSNRLLGSGSGLVRSSTSLIRSIDGLLRSSNGLSRSISRCFGELFVTIINIVEPKSGWSTHWSGCNEGSRENGCKDSETHVGEDLE